MTKRLTQAAALAALAVFGVGQVVGRPAVGDPEPTFQGPDLKGQSLDLAGLKGHVVVVNLWATWCAPCRAELPAMEAVYKTLSSKGLIIVALSADKEKDREAVEEVATQLSFPVAMLSDAQATDLGRPNMLPQTYVIDAGGKVAAVLGADGAPLTEASLTAAVMPLLSSPHDSGER